MPDPNNPNPTQDTPVASLPPAEAPPTIPADLPPMDDSSGSSAPPFDIPPIVTPPTPKKKFGGGKTIVTLLGILVLVGGLGAGVILIKQQQDLRGRAKVPVEVTPPSTPKPPILTPSPPPSAPTPTPYCSKDQLDSCGGKDFCIPDSNGGSCITMPACQVGLTCVPYNPRAGSCPSDYSYKCFQPTQRVTACCKPSGLVTTPTPTGGAPVSCTWQQGIPDHLSGNVCIDSHTRCEVWVVDYGMPYSCPEPPTPKNGTSCVTSKSGQKLCYAGNTDRKNWWLITGTGETTNRNCVQDSTCGGGGGPTAQCLNVKAYDASWTQLSADQLKALKAGDKVRFTVTGSATAGVFDKAKFKINGVESPEITAKKPGTEEFFDEFTIPAGVATFTINAQIHHATLGWSN